MARNDISPNARRSSAADIVIDYNDLREPKILKWNAA